MRDWKSFIKENAIYKEIMKIEKKLDKCNDLIEINNLLNDLEGIREYSVSLIEKVKNSDEKAFEELMQTKDMRNFIYYYAFAINKYHKFFYDEEVVIHEIKFNIFNHIKTRYRIYNKPNEISLLIVSMRKWIRGRVSNSLKEYYFPKKDENISKKVIEVVDHDSSKFIIDEIVDSCLEKKEKDVFELRFYNRMGLVETGRELGISKDSVSRRYKKALKKIKEEIVEQGEQY